MSWYRADDRGTPSSSCSAGTGAAGSAAYGRSAGPGSDTACAGPLTSAPTQTQQHHCVMQSLVPFDMLDHNVYSKWLR